MSSTINIRAINNEYILDDSLNPAVNLKINASIISYKSDFFCAYRTDHLFGFDGKNYLTKLNQDFLPLSHTKLIPEDGNSAIEDIRLFKFNNELLAIYTYLPKIKEKWEWSYGVAVGKVIPETGLITNQQSLRFLASSKHEKNWVPYISEDRLYFIANFEPRIRIISAEGNSGNFVFKESYLSEIKQLASWKFGQIRGGTPFLKNNRNKEDWQYSFVHSSISLPNGNSQSKFYVFTIARFSPSSKKMECFKNPLGYSKYERSTVSRPYLLNAKDINLSIKVVFPMGIMNYKDGVLMSFGKDDVISRLKFYSWAYIESLFDVQKLHQQKL